MINDWKLRANFFFFQIVPHERLRVLQPTSKTGTFHSGCVCTGICSCTLPVLTPMCLCLLWLVQATIKRVNSHSHTNHWRAAQDPQYPTISHSPGISVNTQRGQFIGEWNSYEDLAPPKKASHTGEAASWRTPLGRWGSIDTGNKSCFIYQANAGCMYYISLLKSKKKQKNNHIRASVNYCDGFCLLWLLCKCSLQLFQTWQDIYRNSNMLARYLAPCTQEEGPSML